MSERVVLCTGGVGNEWWLPASRFDDRPWIGGGERSLYELAFACAATGREVELRGNLSRPVFDELAAVTTVRPAAGLDDRRPSAGEIVVHLEGAQRPIQYGVIALSAARPVLTLFAPPGLFGWPFVGGWSPRDPTEVGPAEVGRPEHYRAIAGAGFTLWSNSHRTAEEAQAAGVPCTWIGSGTPLAVPPPVEKRHDLVIVGGNRWEPAARVLAERIGRPVVVTVPGDNPAVIAQLAAARVLLHPMRIEGHSRLAHEARLVGTVPAVLSSNRYLAGASEADGAIVAGDIDALATRVRAVLDDQPTYERLSDAARAFAVAWSDWRAYCARVDAAIAAVPPPSPAREAFAAIGDGINDLVLGLITQRERLREQVDALTLERDRRATRPTT